MKKIVFIISFLFLISSLVFAMKGPTSKPNIIGPKKGPPTKAEINYLKCTKDPDFIGSEYCKNIIPPKKTVKEIGFWEWLWNLILSIFR